MNPEPRYKSYIRWAAVIFILVNTFLMMDAYNKVVPLEWRNLIDSLYHIFVAAYVLHLIRKEPTP